MEEILRRAGRLEPGVSAVRSMVSEARGVDFRALKTLEQAKDTPDAVVIIEGDWGGQIYLTCPAALINIDEDGLRRVLVELDRVGWREIEGAGIYFEVLAAGSGVAGGMGGGLVTDHLWLHPEIEAKGLRPMIEDALLGSHPT